VPTITFGVLNCFFVISHDRRRILHFNITKHPTSSWMDTLQGNVNVLFAACRAVIQAAMVGGCLEVGVNL
jgi:hypothetical protein